jgi:uncharacterized repeat protein (TIGR01451 family)
MKKLYFLIFFILISFGSLAQSNVAVSNTNYQTKYVPGATVTYSISVVNFGPLAATNVAVSSIISSGISQKSWTGPNGSNGSGEINHTIPSLASGQTVSYIFTVIVPQGFSGNLNCTVNAIVPGGGDPNLANNEAIDVDTKATTADVSITNTNNQVIYTPGTTTIYTVKVKNNGPLTAAGITVTNPIPAGITNFSWVGSNGSSGVNVPLSNVISSLFAGSTITYTISVQIPADFTGSLVSQASFVTTTTDGTPSDNAATDTDVTLSGADLVVVNTKLLIRSIKKMEFTT